MSAEFEYIDLIFENCNFVRIPPEYILFLNLVEITTDIWTNVVHQFVEVTNCKKFEIMLDIKALFIKTHLENKFNSNETFEKHVNIYKDITHVAIKVNKDKEFYIGIPWKENGDDMFSNPLQKVEIKEDKFFIRCVSEP